MGVVENQNGCNDVEFTAHSYDFLRKTGKLIMYTSRHRMNSSMPRKYWENKGLCRFVKLTYFNVFTRIFTPNGCSNGCSK